MDETYTKGDRETCEEMQFTVFYRLLYRMRLDLDTETVYQQGNHSLIAMVRCQNKRQRRDFVAVLTSLGDIFQGKILIIPNEIEYSLHPCSRAT